MWMRAFLTCSARLRTFCADRRGDVAIIFGLMSVVLFAAIGLIAGQDGLRDASSKQPGDLLAANGSHGLSRIVDDQSLHLLLQLPGRPGRERSGRPNLC